MAVSIPSQAIADAQAADSELWPVLLAIAGPESTWYAKAKGDYKLAWGGPIVPKDTPGAFPTSFGYLQYYQDGGLGTGIDANILLDGPSNMRLGASYIRGRLREGASLYDALSPWSARPEAWALLQRIQTEGVAGAGAVPMVAGGNVQGFPMGLAAAALFLVFVIGG